MYNQVLLTARSHKMQNKQNKIKRLYIFLLRQTELHEK